MTLSHVSRWVPAVYYNRESPAVNTQCFFPLTSQTCWAVGTVSSRVMGSSFQSVPSTPYLFFSWFFPDEGRAAALLPQVTSFQGALFCALLFLPCWSLLLAFSCLNTEALALAPAAPLPGILLVSCSLPLLQHSLLSSACRSYACQLRGPSGNKSHRVRSPPCSAQRGVPGPPHCPSPKWPHSHHPGVLAGQCLCHPRNIPVGHHRSVMSLPLHHRLSYQDTSTNGLMLLNNFTVR